MSSTLTCEYKGRVAVITIDKDHKLNALSGEEYYLLARYMREIATHDEVFITVLTGKGTALCLFPSRASLTSDRTVFLSVCTRRIPSDAFPALSN